MSRSIPLGSALLCLLIASSCANGEGSPLFTHLQNLGEVEGRGVYDLAPLLLPDRKVDSVIAELQDAGFVLDAAIIDEEEVRCGEYALPVAGEFALKRTVSFLSSEKHSYTVSLVVDANCDVREATGWVSPRSVP